MMKLNIQLFAASKSTSFSESINVESNKSDLSITITFSANNSSTYFSSKKLKCTCNGEEQSKNVSLSKGGKVSTTFTFENITHNNDGSKTVDWSWFITTGTSVLGTLSDSGTRKLTTIPRASEITAANADIGSSTIIVINKKNSNFTTTIDYKFEDDTEWSNICTKSSDTTYGFIIPESFYNKIPNKKYGVCTLRAITYNEDSLIGEKTTTFNAFANEVLCKPVISNVEINDTNEPSILLTGDNTKFIRYESVPIIGWSATAKNGATIVSQKMNGVETTSPLHGEWKDEYVLIVTDSRGFETKYEFELNNVIDYFNPIIAASGKRASSGSSNILLNLSGKFFKGNFSENISNNATFTCSYKESKDDTDTWSTLELEPNINEDGSFYLENFDLGEICDYRKNWQISITVKDRLSSQSSNFIILMGTPNHYWYQKDNENYFKVNGEIIAQSSVKIGNNPIIESGTNENGTYIKYFDGTMICFKTVSGTANITEQYYGYYYHTADDKYFNLGDYAMPFIERPILSIQFRGGNTQWVGSIQNQSNTHVGDIHIISVTSKTAGAYYDIIAFGRWKKEE